MVSRISLYDMLAIFLPGAMVLSAIILLLGNNLNFYSNCVNSVIVWIVFFIVSYLLGLLNNVATSSAVSLIGFRNNASMIARSFNAVYEKLEKLKKLSCFKKDMSGQKEGGICCKILLAVVAIILLAVLIKAIYKNTTDNVQYLVVIPFLVYSIFLFVGTYKHIGNRTRNYNKSRIVNDYYTAYYSTSENKIHDDISIMESQVAFIHSMIVPLLLFILIPNDRLSFLDTEVCNYRMALVIKALVLVGIILILVCAYMRQMTIYRRVWEDYEFLNEP